MTWCFTASQPLRLYQGEERERGPRTHTHTPTNKQTNKQKGGGGETEETATHAILSPGCAFVKLHRVNPRLFRWGTLQQQHAVVHTLSSHSRLYIMSML